MGGLRQRLSSVFWLFVVAGLALAAIFPFDGFWSKDSILGAILERATSTGEVGWYVLYAVGLATAIMTGFYIFRLIFVTFFGDYRGEPLAAEHGRRATAGEPLAGLHAPGAAMMWPMYALGVLSTVGWVIDVPGNTWLNGFLATTAPSAPELSATLFWVSLAAGLICALAGVALAWARYGSGRRVPAADAGAFVTFLRRRWYVDDVYEVVIVRPTLAISRLLRTGVEDDFLEAGADGTGNAFDGLSAGLRGFQTGYLRNYALTILLGAIIVLVYFIAVSQ